MVLLNTGFGGYKMTEIIHSALTIVKFQYEEAGREAADWLGTF